MKRFLSLTVFLFAISTTSALEHLWYYTETPRSRESLFKNIDKIDILAPQTYELGLNGEVKSTMKADVIDLAKKHNVKVMPLLANTDGKSFNQRNIKNMLDNHENWVRVSNYLVTEAREKGYIGWQLDLEYIPVSYADKFNGFVRFLKTSFEANGLLLSAAIVSKISDNPKDYDANYWKNWAGAYDYRTLASSTDFLSIMAYDQPNSPGPVATLGWSKKVLEYSLKNIPPEKISFGIPVYSWAYRSHELAKGKKHFTMVDFPLVHAKLTSTSTEKHTMTTGRGMSSHFGNISWVSYNMFGRNYTIWCEDKESFSQKYNQVKSMAPSAHGVSMWVLGDEDSRIWEMF